MKTAQDFVTQATTPNTTAAISMNVSIVFTIKLVLNLFQELFI